MEALQNPPLIEGPPVVNTTSFGARGSYTAQPDYEHPKICRQVAMYAISPKLLESQPAMSAGGVPLSSPDHLHQSSSMTATRHSPTQCQPQTPCISNPQQESADLGSGVRQLWMSPHTRLGYQDFENYSYVPPPLAAPEAPAHYARPALESAVGPASPKHFQPLPWPQVLPQLRSQPHEPPSFHLPQADGIRHMALPPHTMSMVPCAEQFQARECGFQSLVPHNSQGQSRSSYPSPDHPTAPPDGLPTIAANDGSPLSPCSSTLKMDPDVAVDEELMSPACKSEQAGNDERDSPYHNLDPNPEADSRVSSVAPADQGYGDGAASTSTATKSECEPYAKLIYRAFEDHPQHAMTLQELYQWFRDNTDKGKSEGKGWMNSIRHNLSMNAAFTKRDCKLGENAADNRGSGDSGNADHKKNTEWCLETWALEQGYPHSTTRYRKGCPSRRGFWGSSPHRKSYKASNSRSGGRRRHGSRPSSKRTNALASKNKSGPDPSSSTSEQQYASSSGYQPQPALEYVRPPPHKPLPPIHYGHSSLDFSNYTYPDPRFLAFHSAPTPEVNSIPIPRDSTVRSETHINEPLTPEANDFSMLLPEAQAMDLHGSAEDSPFYFGNDNNNQNIDLTQYRLPRVVGVYDEKDSMSPRCKWEDEDETRYPQYHL